MVDVNTDNLAITSFGSGHDGVTHRTTTGKNNFNTIIVPRSSQSLCLGGRGKPTRIVIVHGDFCNAHLSSGRFSTLHKAITITDYSGNRHAAHKAQLSVAIFHSRVASQIAGLFLCINNPDNILFGTIVIVSIMRVAVD